MLKLSNFSRGTEGKKKLILKTQFYNARLIGCNIFISWNVSESWKWQKTMMMTMMTNEKKNMKWLNYILSAAACNCAKCRSAAHFQCRVFVLHRRRHVCILQKNHFENWKYYSITERSKSNRQFVIQSLINCMQIAKVEQR